MASPIVTEGHWETILEKQLHSAELDINRMLATIGVDEAQIVARLAALEFGEQDACILRDFHQKTVAHWEQFGERYYLQSTAFPAVCPHLGEVELAHLKKNQSAFFSALTNGCYDQEYVRERIVFRVEQSHLGIEREWHLGAYRKYLVECVPLIWDAVGQDFAEFESALAALMKVVMFDLGISHDVRRAFARDAVPHREPGKKPLRTLLLVDDEANILAALKRLLRRDGYEILLANSGQEGLDILAGNAVDVIVSDQRMPGMTGVEFLRAAKILYPDTVRIVLSGYTELESVTDAINEGAIYKFLTKPWDDAQLRGHIEGAFQVKEMVDENKRLSGEIAAANQELASANRQLAALVVEKQKQISRDEISLDIVQELLQKMPLPVIGLGDDHIIVFANVAAQTLFKNEGMLLGSDARQIVPDLPAGMYRGGRGGKSTIQLGEAWFEIESRSMGQGSQSSGMLLTLTPEVIAS